MFVKTRPCVEDTPKNEKKSFRHLPHSLTFCVRGHFEFSSATYAQLKLEVVPKRLLGSPLGVLQDLGGRALTL